VSVLSKLIFKDFRRSKDRTPATLDRRETYQAARGFSSAQNSGGSLTPLNVTAESLSRCSTAQARKLLPLNRAQELEALPLGLMDVFGAEILSVACASSDDLDLIQNLQFLTGKEIRLTQVSKDILQAAIFRAYNSDGAKLQASISSLDVVDNRAVSIESDFRSSQGIAAGFLCNLVDYAIAHKASDLHIIARKDGSFLKIRINGELYAHEKSVCNSKLHSQLISRLKVLAGLDVTKHSMPQDGAFTIPLHGDEVHVRLSILPTIHGEKAVLRFSGYSDLIKLDELGLDSTSLFFVQKFCEQSEGSMIFAGPTGSGKSTSMYAVMDKLAQRNLSLVSIEDPVEVRLNSVSQTSINPKIGLDYECCLRSILRQDPDVILLGEMRDQQSAQIAFQAALTGHLLLTTVHARNVFEVILRLKNLGVDLLTVAQATKLILNQRLAPCLCPNCKVLDLANTNVRGYSVYRAVGCDACDYSGYSGRSAIVEALWIDDELSELIIRGQISPKELKAATSQKNYLSINYSVEKGLKEGKIDLINFARIAGNSEYQENA